jgi:hypothetical protein
LSLLPACRISGKLEATKPNGEDSMNFYNTSHSHYCGIDLHARSLYVCILDQAGEVLLHKECQAKADRLLKLITPFLDNLVIGVER